MFTNAFSVRSMFSRCSYGQANLTRANSLVSPLLKIPCTGKTSTGREYDTAMCNLEEFYEAALEVLRAQAPGINATQYRHHVVLLPQKACTPESYDFYPVRCSKGSCYAWFEEEVFLGKEPASRILTSLVMHQLGHHLVRARGKGFGVMGWAGLC